MDDGIVFFEQDDAQLTDKPHCGDCNFGHTETTDKPHCGDCNFGHVETTDKPHCGDCGQP